MCIYYTEGDRLTKGLISSERGCQKFGNLCSYLYLGYIYTNRGSFRYAEITFIDGVGLFSGKYFNSAVPFALNVLFCAEQYYKSLCIKHIASHSNNTD